MFKYKRRPTTPGEILLEEFLKPLNLSQRELADHLGCDYKVINRIINAKAAVTPEMAERLALALETTPEFWLNAQMAQDLWDLRSSKRNISSLIHPRSIKKAA